MGRRRTAEEKLELGERAREPRSKDELRAQAVEMRAAGATYDEIAAALRVSKSSCSLWLRDLPRPAGDPERAAAAQQRRVEAQRARARRDRDARDELSAEFTRSAADGVGTVSSRDLVLAPVISYWCEGAKNKPWNRQKVVQWMNSDPVLVSLFLEGLPRLPVHHRAAEPPAQRDPRRPRPGIGDAAAGDPGLAVWADSRLVT